MTPTITPYRDHDAATVEALLRAAFGQQAEADLVVALRRDGAMAAEWLAMAEDRIVGYLALSRMDAPDGWLCLAPLAVQPERQGQGIAMALLRHVVDTAQRPVVVLGEPALYEKAGFSTQHAQRLTSPYPLSHTLLLHPGDDTPAETLIYPAAFG
ncbi:Acetyltransferase (GNAT) family protein [Rhodobacteraceae bacterium THAF1]|uniref:GNAT family N-acetyltransferase n=1 Tax=Palleronia sp. THAF1 TaxID=2587842 RepID=UPI000F3B4C61|nr:N-acetyltransferase [Palleronia sp. THAF1]QFU09614.1 Acetyltransferase (GNAT) family protein [Palleronia sp. THAF1]VDC17485.1 Acetyltransferase (GNAT) family protein [Rhodobacteraceae bacterium THAF1]